MIYPNQLSLYAVTDRKGSVDALLEQIESALKGGVTTVQLREKSLSYDRYCEEAEKVKQICRIYHVPFFVNDNLDVAMRCGADGIHVGAEDVSVQEIKRIAPDLLVGATAKTVEQAVEAERAGADYLGVGAVFASPTKPRALPVTIELLTEICRSVKIPVVAIGGITIENVRRLNHTGISGVAVCSALFSAREVEETARTFRALIAEGL